MHFMKWTLMDIWIILSATVQTKTSFILMKKYRNILDAILKKLADTNVGLEVNTGGYHYGLGEPNPCTDIIRRYKELGGEIITIGADAHTPDKIGYAF